MRRFLRGLRLLAAVTVVASRPMNAAERCTISTLSGVAFGSYDVFSPAPLDSTGLVRLQCNAPARTVTVDLGRGNATTFNPRTMVSGTSKLNYNLFMDAARTTIWGDGTGGTVHYSVFDPPSVIDLTVYGRIPAVQDLPLGSYVDAIVVTVNF